MNDDIFFSCPHCEQTIMVKINEINCSIFRCGVFKNNFQQIPPHESKLNCDKYFFENLIFGCGKPFQLVKNNGDNFIPIKCDYI